MSRYIEGTMEEGKTVRDNAEKRFAPEIRDRPDYDGALKTLRRFREMVGKPEPSRMTPETTRGTWAKPDPDAVGWRPRG